MREQVLHYIRERQLLKPGDRVAVAVSGGADSVALLRVLLELRAELGIVLVVAHFNHQLRGTESDADERFVADLARHIDLPFFTGRADVRERAESRKLSLEHAARELRYQWLTELAHEQRFNAIATAHNADDQAETVLMKFLRGAGSRGLAGIHPVHNGHGVRVVRPLLATPRAEIERYLSQLHQPWREDHTNLDTQHTRNRIRHKLLPLLEREYNPSLRAALNETAEVARAEEDFWRTALGTECKETREHPRELLLGGVEHLHVAAQRRLLKRLLEWNQLATDFHHVENLRRCALGETPTANLANGWLATRYHDRLCLSPPRTESKATDYESSLPVPGECYIPEVGITLRAIAIPQNAAVLEPQGSLLRAEGLVSLTVRNWRPGDRFRPAHSGSEKKLKELFADKHIPADQRPHWPVVLSNEQVVWVREFPVAHDFAWVSGSGGALRIEVAPNT